MLLSQRLPLGGSLAAMTGCAQGFQPLNRKIGPMGSRLSDFQRLPYGFYIGTVRRSRGGLALRLEATPLYGIGRCPLQQRRSYAPCK